MNLHFITSISKDYWYATGQYCIKSWNLPGKVTVYVEQGEGDIKWINEIPFNVEILHVPVLKVNDEFIDTKKILKFWGKTCAQLSAVKNRNVDERIIWIDADVEQTAEVDQSVFNFSFGEPLAIMHSEDHEDCWETGLVIFNQQNDKLGQTMKKYNNAWHDDEILGSLWRPYDAQVLGYIALDRGFLNLCTEPCKNIDAMKTSRFGTYFKHNINKDNKVLLKKANEKNSSNLS